MSTDEAPATPSDDSPVEITYSSSRNITFHGTDEIGYTWGEWREMSEAERDEAVQEYVNELVEVYVKGDQP